MCSILWPISFIFAARYCHSYTNIHLHGLTHVLSLFSALARNTLCDNSPYIPNLLIHFSPPPKHSTNVFFLFLRAMRAYILDTRAENPERIPKGLDRITIADEWQKDIRLPVVCCPFAILLKNSERSLALVTFLLLHNLLERNGKQMS